MVEGDGLQISQTLTRNILSDISCWCPIFWGASLGVLGDPPARVLVQKDQVLAGAYFDNKSFKFFQSCLIIFLSGLLHTTSFVVVSSGPPDIEDLVGTDKKYQTSYSH